MKVLAIVQARMGSTRLPGKVLRHVCGKPLIWWVLNRLSLAKRIEKIVLATSTNVINDPLCSYVESLGITVFRGSEENVLNRYWQVANTYKPFAVVRITGDCPLIDPQIVDNVVDTFFEKKLDYFATSDQHFPDGLDTEIFKFELLKETNEKASQKYDLEHVTPFMRNSNLYKKGVFESPEKQGNHRWTVDEAEDLDFVRAVAKEFFPRFDFGWRDILALLTEQSDLIKINQSFSRNQGSQMSTGQKLWRRAKRVIPGGNMLLSKRSEMFLPDQWPAYFSKTKGCRVWDLDGNEFIDMSIMGIGTNILGYSHPEVDEAIKKTVELGNMSTLNCPEEVFLAEKLVEIHPWADMVRLARSGGEANAIAIRIARAASGKDKVAICGYHGWHDWYLSANLGDEKGLDGHLLPGLYPAGVPRNLKNTVLPFSYNNFEELEALIAAHDIGVIKMEVSRNQGPEKDFLQNVRKLATQKGIILIFDECTSGFRETFGGLHKKYGVEPDMAMFGKALGNGYAITATIGRREVMEAAQSTFISSTFWTERIGPTAALKTLEIMNREKSWETITSIGLKIRQGWQNLADKYNLRISHWGLPALTGFTFQGDNALAYKTLITQEMLAKGYLAGNCVYACIEHTPEVVNGFFQALDPIFGLVKECEDGRDVKSLLKGPVCHVGFKRLN